MLPLLYHPGAMCGHRGWLAPWYATFRCAGHTYPMVPLHPALCRTGNSNCSNPTYEKHAAFTQHVSEQNTHVSQAYGSFWISVWVKVSALFSGTGKEAVRESVAINCSSGYEQHEWDLSMLQCEVCVLVFSVTDRRSFHRTAQLRLLLRETQPQTPIILVGNKSDLVRSREVTAQEAMSSAALYNCLYLEISASLDHRTPELLECAVRLARGQSPWPPGTSVEDMSGGGQKESITSRAKRFLSSLVPRYPKEREVGKFLRQKSRSCHDLGAL
uniref:Uncharacterized protein n=1 Tax=Periophthalmus magnuspinnatus TaxID=409849 RepID=A0A3B4A7P1_9GOBI